VKAVAERRTNAAAGTGGAEISLDDRLIGALQEDGRLTNMALARRFGVSEALVRQRLKRLFEANEIRACAIADLRTMGLEMIAFLRITPAPGSVERLEAKLAAMPQVTAIFTTTGTFSICSWVVTENLESLSRLLDDHLREDADVRHIDVRPVVSAYRYQGVSGFIVDEQ
jgi:DNA-binding Lrp family transcriptional regulator